MEVVGNSDGSSVGSNVGLLEGDAVGRGEGLVVGSAVGAAMGETEGVLLVGTAVGVADGAFVRKEGAMVGSINGRSVGISRTVGSIVGNFCVSFVGATVGD